MKRLVALICFVGILCLPAIANAQHVRSDSQVLTTKVFQYLSYKAHSGKASYSMEVHADDLSFNSLCVVMLVEQYNGSEWKTVPGFKQPAGCGGVTDDPHTATANLSARFSATKVRTAARRKLLRLTAVSSLASISMSLKFK